MAEKDKFAESFAFSRRMSPILPDIDQSLRNVALGFLEDLMDLVLRTPTRRFSSTGYAHSFSGCLQFLDGMDHLGRSRDVTNKMQEMVAHLESELTGLQQVTFSLFSGTTGDLWLLDKFCSRPATDALRAVYQRYDHELIRSLGKLKEQYGYDLVSGLLGVAVEQLERRAFPRDERVLAAILDSLFEAAEPAAKGVRWKTHPRQVNVEPHQATQFPEGVYDLGMAHGICGVIAFLSDVAPSEHADLNVVRLLQGAAANLKSHIPSNRRAHIPYLEGSPPKSRLGWCYGDLAVSFALLKASTALHESELRTYAMELAHRSSRRGWQSSLATDHGLCHGGLGISYMFSKIYQFTGHHDFRNSSLNWLKEFVHWLQSEGKRQRLVDMSLLTGVFGQALVLCSLFVEDTSQWDSPLLLGIRGTHKDRK